MPYVLAGLFVLALAVTQAFYGGAMRPVFALPGYAIIGLCGVLGFSALLRRNASAPGFDRVLSVLAFAGWMIWRSSVARDAWLGSNYLRLILACLVVYLIFAFVLTNPLHRLAVVIGLLGLAFLQVALEFWQFMHPHTSFPLPWFSLQLRDWYGPRFETRSHGLYLNANHLAWFLNVVGLLALSAACWGRWSLIPKIVTIYLALMCFAGAILTASRGGVLGLVAGLVGFILLSGLVIMVGSKNRRRIAFAILAAGLLAALLVGAFVFQSSYIVQDRYSVLLGDTYRPALLAVALRQFQLAPLFGTGPGTFAFYACQFRTMWGLEDDIYAHDDWAQLPADFGLPALLLLLIVLAVHIRAGLQSLLSILEERMAFSSRPQSHTAALLVGALSCLVVFVVESVFDFNMQIPVNALLAAATLGLTANPGVTLIPPASSKITQGKIVQKTPMKIRLFGCLLTAAAAGTLLFLTLSAAPAEFAWLQTENAFISGHPKAALKFVKDGLPQNLSHPPFCRLAGLVLLENNKTADSPWERLDNTENAVQLFSRAVADSPLDWKNAFLLGTTMKGTGRFRLAEPPALASIQLNPTQSSGFELYADCLAQEGRLEEALYVYRRASSLPGETHARQNIAEIKRRLNPPPPR